MTAFNPIASGPLGASGGANYALSLTSGTFTLSMQGAGKLITDIYPSGTFAVNGSQIGLLTGNNMFADNGTFTYQFHEVTTALGKGLEALSGTFTLTGNDVEFGKGLNLGAELGTFTLTGQDIPAILDISYIVDVTEFTLTPSELDRLGRNYDITAESGGFAVTFQDADRIGRDYKILADVRTLASTGYSVKFRGFLSPYVPPEIWTEVA